MKIGKVAIGRVGVPMVGYTPIRCDRNVGSPLGNQYKIDNEFDRDSVCDLFEENYHKLLAGSKRMRVAISRIRHKLIRGENVLLQCHCHPKRCHLLTVKNYLERNLYEL